MVANERRLEKRWQVVALWKDGNRTIAEIGRRVGVSHDYVVRWINRYEETGSVHDRPRSGRPKTLPGSVNLRPARRRGLETPVLLSRGDLRQLASVLLRGLSGTWPRPITWCIVFRDENLCCVGRIGRLG